LPGGAKRKQGIGRYLAGQRLSRGITGRQLERALAISSPLTKVWHSYGQAALGDGVK
jgi:hypothetical protein